MAEPPVVLASGSPRRAELLGRLGIDFEVLVTDVDEARRPGEPAADYVARVAADKARAGSRARPGAVVVAADTAVVLDGEPLGKPADGTEAARMLRSLSGRTHTVLTAVVVAAPDGSTRTATVAAEVGFAALGDREIDDYVATGEPLDKAGAYGLQGIGAVLVREVRGDPTTVIGLPLRTTRDLLRDAVQ